MRCDVRQRRICDAMLFKCDAMLFKCDGWERKARGARSLHRLRLEKYVFALGQSPEGFALMKTDP